MQIGHLGHLFLDPVQTRAALIDSPGAVGHHNVAEAGAEQQLHNGDGGGTCAGGDDLYILLPLAYHLQGVLQACQGDHGGAVLVVVEDGNIAFLLQLPLDLKAAGSRNILQIDAAEGAGDQIYRVDEFIHILGLHAQREGVHIAEGLEEDALALHHRHARLGADIAQTQHGGAVGDHGAQVVPPGQLIGFVDVLLDLQTGRGHAGGIGQGQVLLCLYRHRRPNFNFSLPLAMQPQGFLCVIHCNLLNCILLSTPIIQKIFKK